MQDPVAVRKNLGKRIRLLRLQKGWSQERLAEEANMGRTSAGSIERGEKDLRIKTLCKLCDALEKSFAELMQGVDDFTRPGEW